MAEDKVKIGIIGAGYWGINLIRVFFKLGVLDTVCDFEPGKIKQIRRDYPDIGVTLSYADILKDDSVQAVVISTPAETHYRISKAALLAGKDVFVEKPLAMTLSEGMDLVGLAKRKNKLLMVGHLLEYHPAISKLKELIDKGRLGKIQYIYSNRLNLGKIRREENILWSFAPHDVSVMLSLVGELPETVSASGGSYLQHRIADVTVSNINFKSGVKGHIFVSWLHPYKEQKLIVVCDKQMAVFDDVAREDKLFIFNHKIDWIKRVPVFKKEDAKKVCFKMEEPLLVECRHFLRCVRDRKEPLTSGEKALKVLAVLEASQKSLDAGGMPIFLDDIEESRMPKSNNKNLYIHHTATVEYPCQIGQGTKIWHYTHVMKGAKIGKNCSIGQNVFIGSNAELGNCIKVQNNVSIYDGVKLEDGVFCGPSVVFTNVINPRSNIVRKSEFKPTYVKRGATLGANATIVCGNTIGEYAFIGAGSVVTKNIPAYALVYGNPAAVKGRVCQCGAKINFIKNTARCLSCGKEYLNKKETVVLIKKEK